MAIATNLFKCCDRRKGRIVELDKGGEKGDLDNKNRGPLLYPYSMCETQHDI
jgi:hypothetical protein